MAYTVPSAAALTRMRQKSLHVTGVAVRAVSLGRAKVNPIIFIRKRDSLCSVP
jgi:hypothetical protein